MSAQKPNKDINLDLHSANVPAVDALPRYYQLCESALITMLIIPICGWLFIYFYFKNLPELQFQNLLLGFAFWPAIVLVPITIPRFIAFRWLKLLGVKIFKDVDYERYQLLPTERLYAIAMRDKKTVKYLILFILNVQIYASIATWWFVLGMTIWWFETYAY